MLRLRLARLWLRVRPKGGSGEMRDPMPLTRLVSLRLRVTLLSATVVFVAVGVICLL